MKYSSLSTIAERIEAVPPKKTWGRTVGVEIETNSGTSSITNIASALRDHFGLPDAAVRGRGVCRRHCEAPDCGDHLIHPTADGTVTGPEVVCGGPTGSNVSDRHFLTQVEQACEVMVETGASVGPNCGGHVHVAQDGLSWETALGLFHNMSVLKDDLSLLMSGTFNGIRNNGYGLDPPVCDRIEHDLRQHGYSAANWNQIQAYQFHVQFKRATTVEFRGWNASLDMWRIAYHLYVSAAMVEAAVDGLVARADQPLVKFLQDYLPHYVQGLIKRQFAYKAGLDWTEDDIDSKMIPKKRVLAGV